MIMKKDNVRKNVFLETVYRVLTIIVSLCTAPYVSRVLGPDGIGIRSYTLSLESYFAIFATLGTTIYGAMEIARNRDNKEAYSKAFWGIELITILTTAICVVAWLTLAFSYVEYHIYLLIITIQLIAVAFDVSWFYAGLEKFKITIVTGIVFKIIAVVLVFCLIKKPSDLWLYILITCSSVLLSNLFMWVHLPRLLCKVSLKGLQFKRHLKSTLAFFLPTVASTLYMILDKTLIGLLVPGTVTEVLETGEEVVKKTSELEGGYYETAYQIINVVKIITFAGVSSVLGSRISYLFKRGDIAQIKVHIHESLNYVSFIGVGSLFGLLGVSKAFSSLFYGGGYEKTALFMMCLSCLPFVTGLSNCVSSHYFAPANKQKRNLLIIASGAVLNVILSVSLIPFLYGYGAIIGTCAAELLITILSICFSDGFFSFRMVLQHVWRKLIAGVFMLAWLLVFNHFLAPLFPPSLTFSVISLAVEVLTGLIIFCLTLLALRDDGFKVVVSKFKKKSEAQQTEGPDAQKQRENQGGLDENSSN